MKRAKNQLLSSIKLGIEELILFLIVILNLFDFLEFISPEWDYIKKIISWTAIGILLYRAKLSKLFVGEDNSTNDLILLLGYFLLIIKDLISYASSAINNVSSFLEPFFSFLISNTLQLELIGLYLGIFCLLFVSIRLTFSKKNTHHSILKLISPKLILKKDRSLKFYSKKFLFSFFIVLAFFVIVFSLIMSWLAIAIDAPLLIIGLFSYLLFVLKYRKHFSSGSFLSKFGNFGDKFYTRFIEQLKYKRSALRIITGMLVLHLITDAFTYIMPMLLGFGDKLFIGLLSNSHPWFVDLILSQATNIFSIIILLGIYLFSIAGIIFLLSAPVVLFLALYNKKTFTLKRSFLAFIVTSLIVLVSSQTIKIISLKQTRIYGVDIFAKLIDFSINQASIILFGSVALGIIVFFLAKNNKFKQILDLVLLFVIQIWFLIYVASFYLSIFRYYIFTIPLLASNSFIVIAIFLSFLFIISSAFYLFGLLFFIEDTHFHSKQIILEKK